MPTPPAYTSFHTGTHACNAPRCGRGGGLHCPAAGTPVPCTPADAWHTHERAGHAPHGCTPRTLGHYLPDASPLPARCTTCPMHYLPNAHDYTFRRERPSGRARGPRDGEAHACQRSCVVRREREGGSRGEITHARERAQQAREGREGAQASGGQACRPSPVAKAESGRQ